MPDLRTHKTFICQENSMPILLKSLYISRPGSIKSLSYFIRSNCQNLCSWLRKAETKLGVRKETTCLVAINKLIIQKFFKDSTKGRKKTNRVATFSCRPLSNILKYRDHKWDLPIIWKTRFFQTHVKDFS